MPPLWKMPTTGDTTGTPLLDSVAAGGAAGAAGAASAAGISTETGLSGGPAPRVMLIL